MWVLIPHHPWLLLPHRPWLSWGGNGGVQSLWAVGTGTCHPSPPAPFSTGGREGSQHPEQGWMPSPLPMLRVPPRKGLPRVGLGRCMGTPCHVPMSSHLLQATHPEPGEHRFPHHGAAPAPSRRFPSGVWDVARRGVRRRRGSSPGKLSQKRPSEPEPQPARC